MDNIKKFILKMPKSTHENFLYILNNSNKIKGNFIKIPNGDSIELTNLYTAREMCTVNSSRRNIFIFGEDSSGNLLSFDIHGNVFFIDHELFDDQDEMSEECMVGLGIKVDGLVISNVAPVVQEGHHENVEKMIRSGISINEIFLYIKNFNKKPTTYTNSFGHNLLEVAARIGNEVMAKELIEMDMHLGSSLEYAAKNNRYSVVKAILDSLDNEYVKSNNFLNIIKLCRALRHDAVAKLLEDRSSQ